MYRQRKIEKILNTKKANEVISYKKNFLTSQISYYDLSSSRFGTRLYLRSKVNGYMTVENINSVFNYLRYYVKKYLVANIYINLRLLPLIILTSKPSEMRMGKGKGEFNYKVFLIKKGQVLCEIGGCEFNKNKNFMFFVEKALRKKLFSKIEVLSKF